MTPQPSQKGCCDSCSTAIAGHSRPQCFNPQCECHQEAPKELCIQCKHVIGSNSPECVCPCHAPTKAPAGDWAKTALRLMKEYKDLHGVPDSLLAFIESLLTRVREEGYQLGIKHGENNIKFDKALVANESLEVGREEGARAAREEIRKQMTEWRVGYLKADLGEVLFNELLAYLESNGA